MAAKEYSKFQQGVIQRYYDNLDAIKLQRLQELVSELYLADNPRKQQRLWEQVHKALVQLKIKPALIDHIVGGRKVEVLAENLQDWLRTPRK